VGGRVEVGLPRAQADHVLALSRSRAARAVTARVGEGLTRWTRRATGKSLNFLHSLEIGSPAILRDCVRPGHREYMRVEQQPFKLEADYALRAISPRQSRSSSRD